MLVEPKGPQKPETSAFKSDADRLLFLARCLGFHSSEASADFRRMLRGADVPWVEILALADRELLTPALWVRLRDRGWAEDLPREVALQLRRRHAVNLIRNERMRHELVRVIGRLNEVAIEPVVLKGGLDLLVPRYPDPGARLTRDLDVLVAMADVARATEALADLGYRSKPGDHAFVTYYVELAAPDRIAPVDLQWHISGQRDILSSEEALAASLPATLNSLLFRALSPNHQIIHNVLHSELQDRSGDIGLVWLRQLFDLAIVSRYYDGVVDWHAVDRHFTRRGLGAVLRNRLYSPPPPQP